MKAGIHVLNDVRYKNSPDLDTGQTFQLYSSRQETRQRLSLSLAEITSMLDQTKEQVDALRNNI
jgi:hypothetical protein